ncbi:MAG: 2,3-bisphosphoglycerate-independent phosphoglycerate mutase [bacterium]|nr:2,3-bisphosphoglycerate-independent phosphoglycerate mutase [bacterium]
MNKYKPIVLIIVDGWGINKHPAHTAITAATAPNFNSYLKKYTHTQLMASGKEAGLLEGTPGNSEIGHINLGAGRIVYSELTRINKSISDGSFLTNRVLRAAMNRVKSRNSKLHLIGLLSDGGIHSELNHLDALLTLAKQLDLKKVFIHAIMDGSAPAPKSGLQYIASAEAKLKEIGVGKIASVIGRYYAMDRNQQWDRVLKTYRAIVTGNGIKFPNPTSAIKYAYKHKETDEFITPTVITNRNQEPVATIDDGDAVLFFNFRGDRLIELVASMLPSEFDHFKREKVPQAEYITLTAYNDSFSLPSLFPKQEMKNGLGEVLSRKGLTQLRIAETERFAHVTYFFNGMREIAFEKEDRCLIHSPKVESYDLKPEMSAYTLTEKVCDRIKSGNYDFILLNYANPDMVTNTGNFEAIKKAVSVVDECIGKVVESTLAQNGLTIITSTHGSAENIVNSSQHAVTPASNKQGQLPLGSLNPVPFIVIGYEKSPKLRDSGILADVAPTILEVLNLPHPAEMTGKSLLQP